MRRVASGWVAQRKGGKVWGTELGTSDGVYIVGEAAQVFFHLAGTVDDEAGPLFDIPNDPVLLREMATALRELAAWKQRGAIGKFHR